MKNQNVVTENKNQTTLVDTAASINKGIDKIQVDSGIDEEIKTIDTDVKTL